MKKKKGNLEILVIGVVIVLSVIYILFRQTDKVHYKIPELKNIEINSISKISLTKGKRVVLLENRKGGWVVGEDAYSADDSLVQKILNSVATIKLTTLVSKAGNYYKYELDDPRKINVKVFIKKDIVREFDVGKVASTYDHTNIRLKDEKNVYHARGSLKNVLDKTLDELRDKKVFSFDKESVSEFVFSMDGKDHLVNKFVSAVKTNGSEEKKDGAEPKVETEWVYNKNKVEASKIGNTLNILSDLKCDQFVYSEIELKGSELLFSIKLKGATDNEIKIFHKKADKEDDKYIVETSQSKYKFYLKKYRVDNFLNPLKEIFGIKEK